MGILNFLGQAGKELFTPIAKQKTATDKYLNLQRKTAGLDQAKMDKLAAFTEVESARLTKEIEALTTNIRVQTAIANAGGHTAESAARVTAETGEAFAKLEFQKENMLKTLEVLHDQSMAIGARDIATMKARMNYDLEKKMSLLKGLMVGTGGVAGGMFLERALNGGEPEAAVEEMEEATQTGPVKSYFKGLGFGEEEGKWGEPTANLLMDIISPIPRQ